LAASGSPLNAPCLNVCRSWCRCGPCPTKVITGIVETPFDDSGPCYFPSRSRKSCRQIKLIRLAPASLYQFLLLYIIKVQGKAKNPRIICRFEEMKNFCFNCLFPSRSALWKTYGENLSGGQERRIGALIKGLSSKMQKLELNYMASSIQLFLQVHQATIFSGKLNPVLNNVISLREHKRFVFLSGRTGSGQKFTSQDPLCGFWNWKVEWWKWQFRSRKIKVQWNPIFSDEKSGIIFSRFSIFNDRTVAENLSFVMKGYRVGTDKAESSSKNGWSNWC